MKRLLLVCGLFVLGCRSPTAPVERECYIVAVDTAFSVAGDTLIAVIQDCGVQRYGIR